MPMKKRLWHLVVLTGVLLVAIYATNQGLAIALLTPSSVQGSQLESLAVTAWSYMMASVVLIIFDVWLLLRTIRRLNQA